MTVDLSRMLKYKINVAGSSGRTGKTEIHVDTHTSAQGGKCCLSPGCDKPQGHDGPHFRWGALERQGD